LALVLQIIPLNNYEHMHFNYFRYDIISDVKSEIKPYSEVTCHYTLLTNISQNALSLRENIYTITVVY